MEGFQGAMEMVNNLKDCIDTSDSAVRNIVQGTESTANAIQRNAQMCTDISQLTGEAENALQNIKEGSERTSTTVKEGTSFVDSLKVQAGDV